MRAEGSQFPRAAFLLAGVAAGKLVRVWTGRSGETAALRRSIAELHARLIEQESAQERRLVTVESRLDEHEVRLAAVPSAEEIVAAMQELLGRTMQNLHQRLSAQAESIELLKTTVTQTDTLLDRVLKAVEALYQEPTADGASFPAFLGRLSEGLGSTTGCPAQS